MNLVELLKYISNNYEHQFSEKFNNENVLNQTIKQNLHLAIPIDLIGQNFEVKYSTGQGNWAFYPWITIFDKSITSTAQKGYYVAYLFTNDYKEVYLSLNQGWTYFKNKYKARDGKKKIEIASNFWKNEVREVGEQYQFTQNDITLDRITERHSELGYGYASGNIISKRYIIKDLNKSDNEKLLGDLIEMTNLLKDIKSKLVISSDPIDVTNIKIIEGSTLSDIIAEREDEKDRKNEENKVLVLSEEDYNKRANSPSNNNVRVTKIDHEKTNKTKQFNGAQGELLVMNYERQRLSENPLLKDYVNKINHVSETKGDGLGYDIISYDLIDNKVKKIFIEVKTVTGNINSSINISKKELSVYNEKKGNYRIYKVFNYNKKKPELKIISDLNSSSLTIEPSGYIIKVNSLDN